MSTNFFITGLPRSRTAWFSTLFMTGGIWCHHDLLGKVHSLAEFNRQMDKGQQSVGDSDSGLVWLWREFRELFPRARWLLIERDVTAAVASLGRAAQGSAWEEQVSEYIATLAVWLPQYQALVEEMLKDSRVSRVAYADLDDYASVAAAWRFLLPDGPALDQERFELLNALRVEVMAEKVPLEGSAQVIEDVKREFQHLTRKD